MTYQPARPRPKIRASKRFLEVERPAIGERLDYADIVRRQIDRCLMTANDEYQFALNVLALEALIPTSNLTEEYLKEVEKCQEVVKHSTPVTNCGIPVDPDVIPEMVEETVETDWHCRFNAVINLFESMGITWRRIPVAVL